MMRYFKYSMFLLSLLYTTAGWTTGPGLPGEDPEKDEARSCPRSVPPRDPIPI